MDKDLATSLRPSQFNLRQLSVLAWLLSTPEGSRRFLVRTSPLIKYFETGPRRDDGLLPVTVISDYDTNGPVLAAMRTEMGGKLSVDPHPLVKSGLLRAFDSRYPGMPKDACSFSEKIADIYIPGNWVPGSSYYEVAGEWVRSWYEEKGAHRRQKLMAAKVAKDASVLRRAIFGHPVKLRPKVPEKLAALLPRNYSFAFPAQTIHHPNMIATIVSETEKRYRVKDRKLINSAGELHTEMKGEELVGRETLILDNATDEDIARIAAFNAEYSREIEEIAASVSEEIVPILVRMSDRLVQKQSQHQDMLAELMVRIGERDKGSEG